MNNRDKQEHRESWYRPRGGGVCVGTAMIVSILLGGCKEKEAETNAASAGTVEQTAPQAVQIGEGGTRFDPPIAASQIPDGAWMCNMNGKVHYASQTQGDGKCPVCGMGLVHKGHNADEHRGHPDHRMDGDHQGHRQHEEHGGHEQHGGHSETR